MKKIVAFISVCIIVLFLTPNFSIAEENAITNVQLAELVIAAIGITPPPGTEDLSPGEYYEVLSNMLASAGINNFLDTAPGDTVNCSWFVDIIYALAGGTESANTEEKIKYLADNGFMPYCEIDSVITLSFAADVFNNSDFAALVAEAYTPPSGGFARTAAGAPGVNPEGAASRI